MSIYRYSAGALAQIQFRYAIERNPVALVSAREGVNADTLSTIRRAMEAYGWQCVPVTVDGKEILQVTGFKEEGEVAALMATHQFASPSPLIIPEAGDHPTKSVGDWLQHTSLKAAGWLNLIGDAGLLVAGLTNKNEKMITAGALYTGGAAVLARYANVKTEHQVGQVLQKTTGFLKQQAVQMPEDAGLFSIARDTRNGTIQNIEDFLYRYPANVMLSAYALGAFTMFQAGLKRDANGKINPQRVAYGANSVVMKTLALIRPEQDKDVRAPVQPQGTFGGFMYWLKEKPLLLFGLGSMASDVLLGLSAYHEFKHNPKQKGYIFEFISTATYIAADLLMSMSNKDPVNADGKFSPDEQRRVEALAADTILRQPPAMRDGLVNQVSGFLAMQPPMRGKAADISKGITEQMQHLAQNPWVRRTSMPTGLPAQPAL